MKYPVRLLTLLILCLLPTLALAETPPYKAPSAPMETLAPGLIPSQKEDPHPDVSPAPTATARQGPTSTASPEALGYDLNGVLAALPEGLPAVARKQAEVYLRNQLNLKALFDADLAVAQADLEADDRGTAWQTLQYYIAMLEPMEPTLEGVRFAFFDSDVERALFCAESDAYLVNLPIDLPYAYYLMGYLLLEEGEADMALQMLAQSARLTPANSRVLLEYSYAASAAGDLDAALESAQAALRYSLAPEQLAQSYRVIGYCLCERGEYALAASLYAVSRDFSADDQYANDELAYIAGVDAAAVENVEERARETLAAGGYAYGLSDEARAAMRAYRDSGARDAASEHILSLWEETEQSGT